MTADGAVHIMSHQNVAFDPKMLYTASNILRRARAIIKNGAGFFKAHAAGISRRRGSWLACRREMLQTFNSYGIDSGFTGADANRLAEFEHPDLAIADLAGARHIAHRLHHLFRNRIVHR